MDQQIVYKRDDGSFVIYNNGHPYHVPNVGEYQKLWIDISNRISNGELIAIPEPITEEPEHVPFNPGPDYEKRGDEWWQTRFTKKDFLLLCGLQQIIKLEEAITTGNATAKAVHTLLMAAEFIDVTDAATTQLVNILATEDAGNVLAAEDVARILQGVKYVVEAETED